MKYNTASAVIRLCVECDEIVHLHEKHAEDCFLIIDNVK